MGKLKFLIAIGLCAVLLAVPLSGMAENPLPTGNNADGHPWDDNSGDSESPGVPPDTAGTITASVVKMSYSTKVDGRSFKSILRFALTGKWHLLLF